MIHGRATSFVFIRGRVKFGVLRPNRRQVAASHPSALIGWNVHLRSCSELGLVIAPPFVTLTSVIESSEGGS